MKKELLFGIMQRLTLVIMISGFVIMCWGQFGGGDGTEQNPWIIETVEHLNNLRNYLGSAHVNKFYLQRSDIDLNVAPWNEEEGWLPIGASSASSFRGNYNGNGHVIKGLTINRASNYQALFGYTHTAIITNLGLQDVNITGNNYVAGLIGRQDGVSLVQGCYVTGYITGINYIAGIAGYTRDATTIIQDCYSVATVVTTSTSGSHYAGGIVAYQYNGQINRCFFAGCLAVGTVSSNAAPVIGNRRTGGVINDIYWNSDINAFTSGVGNVAYPGQTTLQMVQQATFTALDFNNIWRIDQNQSFPYFRWEGEQAGNHNFPPILPPRNLSSTVGNGIINLTWSAPEAQFGIPSGYNVYRNSMRINDEMLTLTNYQDTDLDNFVAYHHYVTAIYDEEESMPGGTVVSIPVGFPGGTGTEEDPYLVSSAQYLHGVRFAMSSHFMQTDHIDLGVAPWNEGEGWVPIGIPTNSFRGSYNGDGLTISGLTINRNTNNQALFGHATDAKITNLGLNNVDIQGWENVAGVLGSLAGTTLIQGCYVTGNIRVREYYGAGILGYMSSATAIVQDCYSSANIWCSTADANHSTGGIVAHIASGQLRRAYFTGSIGMTTESLRAAPLIGYVSNNAVYSHLYWNQDILPFISGIGNAMLPGKNTFEMIHAETFEGFDFENVWQIDEGLSYPYFRWEGEEARDHHRPPPLPPQGLTANVSDQMITLSWTAPPQQLGVPSGYNIYRNSVRINDQLITVTQYEDRGLNNFHDYSYYATSMYDETESIPGSTIVAAPLAYAGGTGTQEDPYLVSTAHQLWGIKYLLTSHFRQIADINLDVAPWNEEEGWEPIGSSTVIFGVDEFFRGSYDGNRHVINGLTINRNSTYQGLFAYLHGAEIKNLALENININGVAYRSGSLAGYVVNSTITNCYVTGTASIGTGNYLATYSSAFIGVLANSNVTDCRLDVNYTTRASYNGMFAGSAASNTQISNCYVLGSFTQATTGKVVMGSMVGWLNNATISNCYSRAAITVAASSSQTGGLVGLNNGTINNSFAAGSFTFGAESNVGGLVGAGTGNSNNSYWNMETSEVEVSAGGIGKVTRQMLHPYDGETYTVWDFNNIWEHDVNGQLNDGYPALRFRFHPPLVLDPPVVSIEIVTLAGVSYARLRWERVNNALSYKLYASDNPISENWGNPITIVGENITVHDIAIGNNSNRFFRIIASAEPL